MPRTPKSKPETPTTRIEYLTRDVMKMTNTLFALTNEEAVDLIVHHTIGTTDYNLSYMLTHLVDSSNELLAKIDPEGKAQNNAREAAARVRAEADARAAKKMREQPTLGSNDE
jgi:hypothetical protein